MRIYDTANTGTITTIADLRSAYIARNRNRKQHYVELKTKETIARWAHARVIHEMLDRLAICYNTPNTLSMQDVYGMYEAHRWACVYTGQWHSDSTPLNVYFLKALDTEHGTITLKNMRPRYYEGLLAGEYRLKRNTLEFIPPTIAPVSLVMGA